MYFYFKVKFSISFIILNLLFVIEYSSEQSIEFRAKNRICPVQLDLAIYKCIRKHLIDVPHDIHSQTKILDLTGNQITTLHESNFVNLQKLIRLVLDDNKIWKITQNTFLPLVKLTELSLRNNHLSIDFLNSITNKILAPLVSLQRLDLSYNPLGIIPEDLFLNSSTINCLILDSIGNPLTLTPNVFNYLPKLELLSLEENHLSVLPEQIFKHQTHLDIHNIRLANNPWNCNCSMKWLRIALESIILSKQLNYYSDSSTVLHKKHNPSCFLPLQYKSFPMFQVPLNNFICKTEIFVPQINITTNFGLETSLICVFHFAKSVNSTINWYHNNRRIIPSTRTYRQNTFSVNITSILNITSVNSRDSGIYQCQIQTDKEILKKTIYLTVLKSNDELVVSGIRIIFTIGTVLASLIIVIVAILAVVYLIKHRAMFCSDDSKLSPVFNSKSNERETKNQDKQRNLINQQLTVTSQANDPSLALLSTNEYLSIHSTHHNCTRQPFLILPKPAFQCTHNHPFIINQTPNQSIERKTNQNLCDNYTPSEIGNEIDTYSTCPIHGIQEDLDNQNHLSRSTNNSVNINCPLHGYKSENLYYYELSNNYK